MTTNVFRGVILCAAGMLGSAPLMAGDGSCDFTVIKCTDGTVHAIAAKGLSMRIVDDALLAANGTESVSVPLAKLVSFAFSADPAGVENAVADDLSGPYAIYALDGARLGEAESVSHAVSILSAGVYVFTGKSGSFKITVHK